MKASIVIYSAPLSSQAPVNALHFARAWLAAGHTLERVFFYRDGVFCGNTCMATPSDEFDIHQAWQNLANDFQLDLVVCIAAALRRGVINANEARRFQRPLHNLGDSFRLGGLGELVEASLNSDRLVSFGKFA